MIPTAISPENVVVLWSGGVDSTAIVTQLVCKPGFDIQPVYVKHREDSDYTARERMCQEQLFPVLQKKIHPESVLRRPIEIDGNFIREFSSDGGKLIPKRNKLFIDLVLSRVPGANILAMGEYIGGNEDSWVVWWDVPPSDCDPLTIESYLKQEWPGVRYLYLDSFGKATFKIDRVRIGQQIIQEEMFKTTCCLSGTIEDCGSCYCCVERHVAMLACYGKDETRYLSDPEENWLFPQYLVQMDLTEILIQKCKDRDILAEVEKEIKRRKIGSGT